MTAPRGRWVTTWRPDPWNTPVVLCLPPAGAGGGRYRAAQAAAGGRATVAAVTLPGRETRWREPVPDSVPDAVAAIADELDHAVPDGHPLVVFGQSLGGLLAYELVRERHRRGRGWPTALVVAACRPPALWAGAGRGLAADPAALAGLVDDRTSVAGELDPDTREMVLELLAADAAMTRDYAPSGADRAGALGCPLEVWGGEDDRTVTPEHLAGWEPLAGAGFRHRVFPGGHYFTDDRPDVVLDLAIGLLDSTREGALP